MRLIFVAVSVYENILTTKLSQITVYHYRCRIACGHRLLRSLLQLGILAAFALSPVLVGRSDTNEVCGNKTHHPDRNTAEFADWSNTISNELFYYLLGQSVLSLAILMLTLAGMHIQFHVHLCVRTINVVRATSSTLSPMCSFTMC